MLSSYLVSKMTQHFHLTLSLSLILWEVKAADTHLSHLWTETKLALKTLDTFGVCQRPVFSLSVSQHMHEITSLWKFGLNRSTKLRENDERNNTLVGRICVLSDGNKRLLARSLLIFQWEITSFSKNYATSEGVVSHNVLYYQQLSNACYQVS